MSEDNKGKPVVAQGIRSYLPLTQTWIYSQLRQMRRHAPIVFTNSIENPDDFPFRSVYVHNQCTPHPPRRWQRFLWWRIPLYPFSYAHAMRQRNVALLHAHFGDEAFRLLGVRLKLRVPMVVTFYGYDVSSLPRHGHAGSWRLRLRLVFAAADRILAEGPHMRRALIALGCPPEKVQVQHLGVDIAKLPFAVRSLPSDGAIRVLLAASFREKKGIPFALAAFAAVARGRERLQMVLVGDGLLRPQIERQIAKLGLAGKVHLLGYQSHSDLIKIAGGCHLALAPSVTASNGDTEGGAPVSLIEAQAMGIPVIASRHADIPEVVLDGRTGYLVPERDVDALVGRLEDCLAHPERWAALGAAGRRHVAAEFALDRQVERLECVYDSLLGHRVPA